MLEGKRERAAAAAAEALWAGPGSGIVLLRWEDGEEEGGGSLTPKNPSWLLCGHAVAEGGGQEQRWKPRHKHKHWLALQWLVSPGSPLLQGAGSTNAARKASGRPVGPIAGKQEGRGGEAAQT